MQTQETTFWQHQECGDSAESALTLTDFLEKLRDLPTPASTPTFSFELPLSDKSVSLNALLEPLLAAAAGH